jgi:alkylated DNA repair dioxygenase AlkB
VQIARRGVTNRRMKRSAADFFKPKSKEPRKDVLVCPACGTFTGDEAMISLHLSGSFGCGQAKKASPAAAPTSTIPSYLVQNGGIPGLIVVHNFITEEEEQDILKNLDLDTQNPWKPSTFNGKYDVKGYGLRTELRYEVQGARQVHKAVHPMPGWADFLHERIAELPPLISKVGEQKVSNELKNWRANEFNANRYNKSRGHVLEAHFDDRHLSGPILANISLGCDSVMRYERLDENSRDTVDVVLPRRTLQLVAGAARYNWTHSIPRELMEDAVRTSITMRQAGKRGGVVPSS